MSLPESLLEGEALRFTPPVGDEWPEMSAWTDREWGHWLREHNKYSYLHHWTDEAIHRYLSHDRYAYGLGVKSRKSNAMHWFYNPTPVAVPFHATKVPNILFGGAAGGSKSHSARFDAYRHCMVIPEFRAIIMRRTFEELKRNHIDKARGETQRFDEMYGGKGRIMLYESEKEIRFDIHGTGRESKILFGHCQNIGDEEKYLGDAYDAFYPDEMATFHKKQIIGVSGRLRTEKRGVVPRLGGTSNPAGSETLWLKEWFIDKLEEKIRAEDNPRYRADRHHFIPAMLYDNPYYMDPDGTYTNYEERLFAYDSERRKQLLLGDWTALTGQFFPEFSAPSIPGTESSHVKDLYIPEGSKIERWIDWGYDPHYGMCLWVAIFPNGRIYVFDEWKFNGANARQKLVAAEVAKRIAEMTTVILRNVRSKRITKSVCDPSMGGKDGHSGEDYIETFRKNGVSCIKGDNDRVLGWGRLRHWFRRAPDGIPWLVIHPRCTTTVRTIPGLVRDEHDPDDLNTNGEDHPADALRYGVMARPSPPKTSMAQMIVVPDTPSAWLREMMQSTTGRLPGQVA